MPWSHLSRLSGYTFQMVAESSAAARHPTAMSKSTGKVGLFSKTAIKH